MEFIPNLTTAFLLQLVRVRSALLSVLLCLRATIGNATLNQQGETMSERELPKSLLHFYRFGPTPETIGDNIIEDACNNSIASTVNVDR